MVPGSTLRRERERGGGQSETHGPRCPAHSHLSTSPFDRISHIKEMTNLIQHSDVSN